MVELYSGMNRKVILKEVVIEKLLANFVIIELDRRMARFAGILRSDYRKATPDTIIAATAVVHKLTLVTRNVKDFQRMSVEGFEIIKPY